MALHHSSLSLNRCSIKEKSNKCSHCAMKSAWLAVEHYKGGGASTFYSSGHRLTTEVGDNSI